MTRLITRYLKLGSSQRSVILWVLVLLALVGCDGGIFGTGDGEDILDAGENPATDAIALPEPFDPAPPVTTSPSDPAATPDATAPPINGTTFILEAPDNEFSNTVTETDRPDALLRLILANSDLDDSIVVTNNGNSDEPLLPLPGLFFLDGIDNYRAVPAATDHNLQIFLSEAFRINNTEPVIALSPLEVSAGSVTTVIVRGGSTSVGTSIGILAAETKVSAQNGNSQLRAVHAARAYSGNGPLNVYLVEAGDDIEDAVWTTNALSYVDSPVSDYADIPEGQYDIIVVPSNQTDLQIQINNQIELNSEQVLTVVIRDDPTLSPGEGVSIVVVEDSILDVE